MLRTISEVWAGWSPVGSFRPGVARAPSRSARPGPGERLRYVRLVAGPGELALDLSTGVPDHELLPARSPALRRVGVTQLTTSYLDEPVLPPLEAALRVAIVTLAAYGIAVAPGAPFEVTPLGTDHIRRPSAWSGTTSPGWPTSSFERGGEHDQR